MKLLGGGHRGRDRRCARGRGIDDCGASANAEPMPHREAVEKDGQDDDQGDQEDRHHRRTGATVAIVVLVNDCHDLPPWYLDDLVDTVAIISVVCADVKLLPRSELFAVVNMWMPCE